jgi:NTP pyrophosphatase (non-canonical NTP hydrolase)
MLMDEYQERTQDTAVYPGQGQKAGLEYTLFGLLGEAGELANKYKKILRKEENPYYHREVLMDELGDVLWYAAALARELGYSLADVSQANLQKLAARKEQAALEDHPPDSKWDGEKWVANGVCIK